MRPNYRESVVCDISTGAHVSGNSTGYNLPGRQLGSMGMSRETQRQSQLKNICEDSMEIKKFTEICMKYALMSPLVTNDL